VTLLDWRLLKTNKDRPVHSCECEGGKIIKKFNFVPEKHLIDD
jgi:hypothetical protein